MFRREGLVPLDSLYLAVLCGELATNSVIDGATRETAFSLMMEWERLRTPPIPNDNAEQDQEAKESAARDRMIDFLLSV